MAASDGIRDPLRVLHGAGQVSCAQPFPLRRYRTTAVPPIPSGLSGWRCLITIPPYTGFRAVNAARVSPTFPAEPLGQILIASPEGPTGDALLEPVEWLLRVFPWISLVVNIPASLKTLTISEFSNHAARVGALVLRGGCEEPKVVARAVTEDFVPQVDLPRWLRRAAPRWPSERRARAVEDLISFYRHDPETQLERDGKLPRHQRIWQSAGRALKAAMTIQRADGCSLLKVAFQCGYADHRAMDRAILRKFGVYARELRGTAGWKWLMWRFLTGRGRGRENRWDQ